MRRNKRDPYEILENNRNKHKVTCSCGTKTILYNVDRKICRGCHHYVFKNKEAEFKFRLKEKMMK